jgi:hypothetical protein
MFNHLEEVSMQSIATKYLVAVAFAAMSLSPVHAQSDASALSALSALPLASVVAGAGASVAAVPVVLSAAGGVLIVKAVEVSALGTVYLLERASDGAHVSVEVAGRGLNHASIATGALVKVSVIGSGVILSVAGQAIAFVPNALGRALLHNERLTG